MSRSARRLAPSVSTDRFAWQDQGRITTPPDPEPLFAAPPRGPIDITPAMRDLPSPTAERIQAIERDAFAKGYAQGERAGEKAAAVRTEATLQRLAGTIQEIASLRSGVMRRAERELVRLAIAIAERVLGHEITTDREQLLVMARAAAERLGDNAVATIHLNPSDYEAVLARRDPDTTNALEIIADANIPRGGCLVKSGFGSIDASIEAQIHELSRALLGDQAADESESLDDGHAGA